MGRYLEACLNSVVNQTLKEIEIICVNDGSTDGTEELLKEYCKTDNRIRVISYSDNVGVSHARNIGLAAATGKWIMFVDGDDCLYDNACECVFVEGTCEATDIIVFGAEFFPKEPSPSNAEWLTKNLQVKRQRFWEFDSDVLFHTVGSWPFTWRQAFSHDFLKKYDLKYDEEILFAEDALFQFEAFPHANNISFIDSVLYKYRATRQGSQMETIGKSIEEKLSWHVRVVEKIYAYWNDEGFLEKYGEDLMAWAVRYAFAPVIKSQIPNKYELSDRFIKMLAKYEKKEQAEAVIAGLLLTELEKTIQEKETLLQKLKKEDEDNRKELQKEKNGREKAEKELVRIKNSKAYRLGNAIAKPWRMIIRFVSHQRFEKSLTKQTGL